MAINTTGNNGSVVGVTGVHPDNIGKGLLWDPATKTYYVAVDDRTFEVDELGRLKLRVSALEDNQLKVRDDGVYQGSSAKPELRYLFVDAENGVDQHPLQVKGAGTRQMPLRTLAYALTLRERYTSSIIYLREGQNHIYDCSESYNRIIEGKQSIRVYGDRWNQIIRENPNKDDSEHRQIFRNEGLMPTLKFMGYKILKYLDRFYHISMGVIDVSNNAILEFDLINIHSEAVGHKLKAPTDVANSNFRSVNKHRIYGSTNANISIIYANLSSRYEFTFENGQAFENGVDSLGIVYPINSRFILERILDLSLAQGKVVGHQGWNFSLTNQSQISIKNARNDAGNRELGKLITIFQKDPQNNSILAPIVDLPTEYFS